MSTNPSDFFDQTGDRAEDEALESATKGKVIGISIYGTIKVQTPKAYLVVLACPSGKHDVDSEHWIPKSQCLEMPDDTGCEEFDFCFTISSWIAEQKGLTTVSKYLYDKHQAEYRANED